MWWSKKIIKSHINCQDEYLIYNKPPTKSISQKFFFSFNYSFSKRRKKTVESSSRTKFIAKNISYGSNMAKSIWRSWQGRRQGESGGAMAPFLKIWPPCQINSCNLWPPCSLPQAFFLAPCLDLGSADQGTDVGLTLFRHRLFLSSHVEPPLADEAICISFLRRGP